MATNKTFSELPPLRRDDSALLTDRFNIFQSLINAIPIPLFYKDVGGHYLACNVAFENLIGSKKADIEGKDFPHKIVWENDEAIETDLSTDREVISSKSSTIYNTVFHIGPQKPIHAVIIKTPFTDDADDVKGVFGIVINTTHENYLDARLADTEGRYHLLFNNTADGVLLTTPDGEILAANKAACRMFGRTERELRQIGRNGIIDLNDPRFFAALEQREQTGTMKAEHFYIRKDGTRFLAQASSSIFQDSTGRLMASTIIRDVTQLRKAEEEVKQSEEKFRRIIETTTQGFCAVDSNFKITFVNKQMANMLLCPNDADLVGDDLTSYALDEDVPGMLERRKGLSEGIPQQCERRFYRKDATMIWVRMTSSPIIDEQGNFAGSFSLFADITSRKEAEKALHQSEEKYRSIFENAMEGIFQITKEGRFLTANPALARMYGYDSPQELISSITDIEQQLYVDPDKDKELFGLLENAGPVRGFEARRYRKDGSIIWVSLDMRSVKTADGLIVYEGMVQDITQKKQAQFELKRSEERFRLFFDQLGDAVFLRDIEEDRFVEVSHIACERLEYTREELLRMTSKDVESPAALRGYAEREKKLYANGSAVFNTEHMSRAGSIIPTEVSSRIISVEGKRYALSIARNVTERKRLESLLAKSEKQYRDIYNNITEGIFQISKRGKFITANPSLAVILGHETPEELMRSVVRVADICEKPDEFKTLLRRLEVERRVTNFEVRLRKRDGALCWMSINVYIVSDDRGESFYEGTAVDIDGRRSAENSLREQTGLLQDTTAALRVLLKQREQDKSELERNIVSNLSSLVFPYLSKLQTTNLTEQQSFFVNIVKNNLADTAGPFAAKMGLLGLTATELTIINLIKNGSTTKDIMAALNMSKEAVDLHRYHIRKKLGITNTKMNLQAHLKSML